MATRKRILIPTEKQEHKAFVQWIKLNPNIDEVTLHIPNEYDGGAIKGRQRKLMGVKKGVCDFFIAWPRNWYHGLWIELKRKKGSIVSPEQKLFIETMIEMGYYATVCYGCDEAIQMVKEYLK